MANNNGLTMTCVVAIKKDGVVYMGADSAGSAGFNIRTRVDPKIHIVGPYILGFTSSFRMGQLLGHAFEPPVRDSATPVDKFMSTIFIDAIRKCLKDGGWASKSNETEAGGNFLVGYEGRIFNIFSDYQVGETALDYEAIGCGEEFAMGALFACKVKDPEAKIKVALEAAEHFSCGVRGPFIFNRL
jgi:ATP-dependent protease HslVU (ClpYQ) peptidase subunit